MSNFMCFCEQKAIVRVVDTNRLEVGPFFEVFVCLSFIFWLFASPKVRAWLSCSGVVSPVVGVV